MAKKPAKSKTTLQKMHALERKMLKTITASKCKPTPALAKLYKEHDKLAAKHNAATAKRPAKALRPPKPPKRAPVKAAPKRRVYTRTWSPL